MTHSVLALDLDRQVDGDTVAHVLRHCGTLTAGEALVIVCDRSTRDIAKVFAEDAGALTDRITLHEVPETAMHGAEPPATVAAAMLTADLILGLTRMSMAHTRARLAACRRGARYLSLPDYSAPLLNDPALTTDFHAAAPRVRRFADALDRGSRVRVTSARGTDIALDIAGRAANCCPGLVDGPGALGSPPDIEANISPLESKSNGVIVVDGSIPCREIGLLRTPVILTVRDGAMCGIASADAGLEARLSEIFARVGAANAYILGECGIGLNPAARLTGNMLTDEGAFGCVHFGFGSNATVGGVNDVPFHLDCVLREPTLQVDDVILIQQGEVVL